MSLDGEGAAVIVPALSRPVVILTLVHPDFLPSVYAISDVLGKRGYTVDVFSFLSRAGRAHTIGSLGHYGRVVQRPPRMAARTPISMSGEAATQWRIGPRAW